MSQALDLAMSVCSGAVRTDNIVHDWKKPLVVGSPETGEIAVFAYNPVLHRMEIEVASQSQGDSISLLSFDSLGNLLVDDVPLASQANLEDAVNSAASSAASAAADAATAQSSLTQVLDAVANVSSDIADFEAAFAAQQAALQVLAAQASQSSANAAASAASAASSQSLSSSAAGASQAAAADAAARASANSGVTFADGTKSAAAYAEQSRQTAQASRLAVTRPLVVAGFPETFQPGFLFKRARVTGGGARVVTVPQGIWPLGAGEAWATYRLEEAGSVQIVKQAGNTTGEVIPTLNTHTLARARYGTLGSSQSLTGVVTVPAVASGRLVIMVAISWANVVPVTVSCSIVPALGGSALTVTTRQAPRTPPLTNQNPHFAIFEAPLSAFAGGDLAYTVVAGPDANFDVAAAFVVSGMGIGAPQVAKAESSSNLSQAGALLTGCPASGMILALGVQRGVGTVFSSFSSNVTPLASGNLQGVPTANDNDTAKNAAWGYGVGVLPTAGDPQVFANFANANGGSGCAAICYPPGTGSIQPLVNMVYVNGRDTLNQVGQEATLWFPPDGRTVYVNIPAA